MLLESGAFVWAWGPVPFVFHISWLFQKDCGIVIDKPLAQVNFLGGADFVPSSKLNNLKDVIKTGLLTMNKERNHREKRPCKRWSFDAKLEANELCPFELVICLAVKSMEKSRSCTNLMKRVL